MVPHLKQMGPVGIIVVVVAAAVDMQLLVRRALHSNTIYTSMHVLTRWKPWAFAGLNAFNPRVIKL